MAGLPILGCSAFLFSNAPTKANCHKKINLSVICLGFRYWFRLECFECVDSVFTICVVETRDCNVGGVKHFVASISQYAIKGDKMIRLIIEKGTIEEKEPEPDSDPDKKTESAS